jgi:hypothetical protein
MRKCWLLALSILLFFQVACAQKDWTLKSNRSGLDVYTKTVASSGLKGIKVKCTLPATLTQMVALVMDVGAGIDWVYATKSSRLLKMVSDAELYYYSEVEVPWPLCNRDFISHLTVSQNSKTKVVTIVGPTEANYLPKKEGLVRVSSSYGKWVITPQGNKTIHIEYTLEVDPGGNIPVWLVNLFATSGPTLTFKKMATQVQLPKYVNAKLSYISND